MPSAAAQPVPAPATRRGVVLGLLLFAGVLAWVFQDVLFRGRLLCYRDSLHFYYPLYQLIHEEWAAGRVPLWNPYSNCGQPLLAAPTSAALYPLQALFFLPLSYWACHHLYVLLHVMIAGAGCAWATRKWGGSRPAATLAAVSYAFGGNVLFQYCNLVFLCGAAWLPWVLWSGDRMLRERSLTRTPLFSALLALTTLAGDPEIAYVAGFGVAFEAFVLWRRDRRVARENVPAGVGDRDASRLAGWRSSRLLLLTIAAALSFGLAAPQVLPTLDWSGETVRASRQTPASLYDVPKYLLRERELRVRPDTKQPSRWYEGLIGDPPPPARHESMVYEFSFEPWHLVEFLWPNIAGRLFPEDHLWMWAVGWDRGIWVLSAYLGLLPFLLGAGNLRLWGEDTRRTWLSWLALLSLLASFGRIGPGLLFLEPTTLEKFMHAPGITTGGVGGVYWLMTLLLPGFSEFRYPAKLLVLTTCAISLLAGAGLDGVCRNANALRRWKAVLLWAFAVSALLAVVAEVFGHLTLDELRAHGRSNRSFVAEGALSDIRAALWHGTITALALWLVLRRTWRRTPSQTGWRGAWPLVMISVLELGLANRVLINTTDRDVWERTPALVTYLRDAATARGIETVRPLRVHRLPDWMHSLAPSIEELQQSVIVRWQRAALQPMQHLPFHIGYAFVYGTMDSYLQGTWFDHLKIKDDPETELQARRSFDAWGTSFFVIPNMQIPSHPKLSTVGLRTRWDVLTPDEPTERILPLGGPLEPGIPGRRRPTSEAPDAEVLYNDSAFPPAWIVHRIEPMADIEPWDQKRWLTHLSELVHPLARPWDLRVEASVQSSEVLARLGPKPVAWPADAAAEACRIVSYAPQEVEIEATLGSEGMVVLSDLWTHDWKARVSTDGGAFVEQPVYRTNITMRGILLPAGNHVIRYSYEPRSFSVGTWLCAGTVLLLACGWGLTRRQGRASRRSAGAK